MFQLIALLALLATAAAFKVPNAARSATKLNAVFNQDE
jgi:hypothetical protein